MGGAAVAETKKRTATLSCTYSRTSTGRNETKRRQYDCRRLIERLRMLARLTLSNIKGMGLDGTEGERQIVRREQEIQV